MSAAENADLRRAAKNTDLRRAAKHTDLRRKDRAVTDFAEIADILRRANVMHLGLQGEDYPYVVPLSYGFEATDGVITVYFHGAQAGLKHTLLAQNPRVCVEASILHRCAPVPGSYGAAYESVIGRGIAERIEGAEALHGLALLMEHCGFAGGSYDERLLAVTAVYKVTLARVTGKRCVLPKDQPESGDEEAEKAI